MKHLRFICLAATVLLQGKLFAAQPTPPRERLSLNDSWHFTKGDSPEAGTNLSYAALRPWILPTGNSFSDNPTSKRPAGEPVENISFAQTGFNDSQWRLLNLPHDWGVEGPFTQEYPGATAKLPWWGVAWYRKHLQIPATDTGRKIYLDVDGAMSYASVWLNGHLVGGWPYGYTSWRVDLTPYVHLGADNLLAIRLDNPPDSSRWYPGGGIYRNVWLEKTAPIHIGQWGTQVTTPEVTEGMAKVVIQSSVDNDTDAEVSLNLKNDFFELNEDGTRGKSVASLTTEGVKVASHQSQISTSQIALKKPRLWSIEKPNRYVVITSIEQTGKMVDRYETPFGIRTIEFTADNGFLLNGKRVPIKGVCNHSDLGALGTVVNTSGLKRQITILQRMGCNAIRTSHNMPSPELLDLCDQLGMLVMDESFDSWETAKTKNDYSRIFYDWHQQDWRAELRRDRNHPSVVLWSIGNEVPEQTHPDKFWIPSQLTGIASKEDATRPTTSANNDQRSAFNDFRSKEAIYGVNYKPSLYGKIHGVAPQQPVFGSETASCISSRGEYFFPVSNNKAGGLANFQVSSYDLYAPSWATPPDAEFKGQDEFPFVFGEFVWTGFDYLGEPTPYNKDVSNLLNVTDPTEKARLQKELDALGKIKVPSRSSYFGIIDLAGFPKDRFYLYQARWRPELPMAHILPHWNWPERIGQVTPVMVYTSGDEAELFLNGKSMGRKTIGKYEYRLRWDDVIYQPGELKVVAYKNGKHWATEVMKTTGAASKLAMQADHENILADGRDLAYVTLTVADKNGLLVPRSKNHIKFSVEGPGEIVATDNGDATSFESFQSPERNAFNGLALVIVRAKAGEKGTITLKAEADGLQTSTLKLHPISNNAP